MKEANEIWRDVVGYEGRYQVSNIGRVKSLKRKGRLLKPIPHGNGYLVVSLYKDGVQKILSIHRLVAIAFIPNAEGKPQVDHINTNKKDNCVENLRWCTSVENNNNELTLRHFARPKSEEHRRMVGKVKSKPVVQYLKDGVLVKQWPSARIAQQETGVHRSSICECCQGKRSLAGGYVWKYAN